MDAWKQDVLRIHNEYRAKHGSPPLTWSEECYAKAKKQADACQKSKKLSIGNQDGPSGRHGQNAYFASPSPPAGPPIQNWYSSMSKHNFHGDFQPNTGNFCQLVWAETMQVGMAKSEDGTYVFANYFPAGNTSGGFKANVKPVQSYIKPAAAAQPAAKPAAQPAVAGGFAPPSRGRPAIGAAVVVLPTAGSDKSRKAYIGKTGKLKEDGKDDQPFLISFEDGMEFWFKDSEVELFAPAAAAPAGDAPAAAAPAGSADDWKQEAISVHNDLRVKHGAPPLVWGEECYAIAKKYADACQKQGKFGTSNLQGPSGRQGQNVYFCSPPWRPKETILGWYNGHEKHDFCGEFQQASGNFTQLIWKGTTHFAMARSEDGQYVISNYFPAGNITGAFSENVRPVIGGQPGRGLAPRPAGGARERSKSPQPQSPSPSSPQQQTGSKKEVTATSFNESIAAQLEGCPFAKEFKPVIVDTFKQGGSVTIIREQFSIKVNMKVGGATSSKSGNWG